MISVVRLWVVTRWRPSRHFRPSDLRGVANFSLNLTVFNVFNFLFLNADKFLVGSYLGAAALGVYGLGQQTLMYPVRSVTRNMTTVLFPTFARIQDDNERIGRHYLSACGAVAALAFPAMAGIAIIADPLVRGFLNERWLDAIPIMMILAPVGMLHALHFTVGALYNAKGRADILLKWGVGSGIFTVAAYIAGLPWGTTGVAATYAIAVVLMTYPAFAIPFRLIDLPFSRLIQTVLPYTVATAVMSALVVATRIGLEQASVGPKSVAAVCALVGAVVYVGWMWRTRPPALTDLAKVVTKRRGSRPQVPVRQPA
ncbi:MAG: oligosaccharide flippase family protein [Ilumatobacteraceae bacterium]